MGLSAVCDCGISMIILTFPIFKLVSVASKASLGERWSLTKHSLSLANQGPLVTRCILTRLAISLRDKSLYFELLVV